MPKHYAVTPIKRPGKTVYRARFWNANQIRVARSLATPDAAKLIAQGLVSLHNAHTRKIEDVPNGVPPESVRLFFGIKVVNWKGDAPKQTQRGRQRNCPRCVQSTTGA